MKYGFFALKGGGWGRNTKASSRLKLRATEWAFERKREAFGKVAKDEEERLSIVQGIMLKNTDFLRRIFAPAGGQGSVTMSYLCPNCNKKEHDRGDCQERQTLAETHVMFANTCCIIKRRRLVPRFDSRSVHELGNSITLPRLDD